MVRDLSKLVSTVNEHLPISEIARFPVLDGVLQWWRSHGDGLPPGVDPVQLPPRSLRHLILVDLPNPDEAVIRLAGTLACDIYGRELKGTSVHAFFDQDGAGQVLADLRRVQAEGSPLLTRRHYVSINQKMWSYTRLLVPIQPDPTGVARVLKALEPVTFQRVSAPAPGN
jgi:hypothetical protein